MNSQIKTILLATDGSEDAILAARAAGDLSQKTGAELHLVRAWQTVPSAHFEGWIHSTLEQEAREALEEQTKKIRDSGGEVSGSHLKKESPAKAILELASEIGADLIVMGSRGAGRLKRLATGSVSEGVVHNANVPVLMLRGGDEAWPPKHVVAGEDGTGPAREAGELAAEIGNLTGAGMTLLRVYPELPEVYEEGRKTDPRLTDDGLHQAEMELEKTARRTRRSSREQTQDIHSRRGRGGRPGGDRRQKRWKEHAHSRRQPGARTTPALPNGERIYKGDPGGRGPGPGQPRATTALNKELFRKVGPARLFVWATVALGLLAAVTTVVQMVLLAKIVDQVFLKDAGLAGVQNLLLLLLAAAIFRAALVWVREVVAQRGAVRVKSELRSRLFAHILRLGPAYAGESGPAI